jgi:hypothetical protein
MKAAADFTREVWTAISVPIIMFIAVAGFFAFWIVISLYIFSCGTFAKGNGPFA